MATCAITTASPCGGFLTKREQHGHITLHTCVAHDFDGTGTIAMRALADVLYELEDTDTDTDTDADADAEAYLDSVVISSPFKPFTDQDMDALSRALVDRGVLIVLLLCPNSLAVGSLCGFVVGRLLTGTAARSRKLSRIFTTHSRFFTLYAVRVFCIFFPQKTLFDDKVKTDGVFEAVKCLHAADAAAANRALCIHAEDDGHALPFATSDLATVIRRMTPAHS